MIVGIIQARMASTRLPGKVLKPMNGVPMLEHVIQRVRSSQLIDSLVVVTSEEPADREIVRVASGFCQVVTTHAVLADGSNDVLAWFAHAVDYYATAQHIVRITGDCPLWCGQLGDEVIAAHVARKVEYTSNVNKFVDGFDTEVFTVGTLLAAHETSDSTYERHHVTPWMRRNSYSYWVDHTNLVGGAKLSVDTQEDFDRCEDIIKAAGNTADHRALMMAFGQKGYPLCSDMPSPLPASTEK